MIEYLDLLIGFGLGLFSSLLIYWVEQLNKERKEILIFLSSLENTLHIINNRIVCVESSCKQYLLAYDLFRRKEIKSIGFPKTKDFRLNLNIPLSFQLKFKATNKKLNQLMLHLESLNDGFSDFQINNTKEKIIAGDWNYEEGLKSYESEIDYVKCSIDEIKIIINILNQLLPYISGLKDSNISILSYIKWRKPKDLTKYSIKSIKKLEDIPT